MLFMNVLYINFAHNASHLRLARQFSRLTGVRLYRLLADEKHGVNSETALQCDLCHH